MGSLARVTAEWPRSVAWLGDLSARGGGGLGRHKSHESGRDIDIFYYAVDAQGRPYVPKLAMLRFGPDGRARSWSPPDPALRIREPVPEAWLDTARTWALVRAMLEDGSVEVQWIFIHDALAGLLLDEGRRRGDAPALVQRAAALFHRPRDAQPHDDHMHVRVFCDPTDRPYGCKDRGPVRWWKKRWKYLGREGGAAAAGDGERGGSYVITGHDQKDDDV
jgi:penicillin-insensitive murein endopeptidase